VVPYQGCRIELDSVTAARWAPLIQDEGASVSYRNRIVFINGIPATSYTFSRDYFLPLGDNSADSYDGRYFGFVPEDNLIGQALIVYWSRIPDGPVRWERIGAVVR
jgi:signal peptidase I